jgi:hypothetical protein
MLSDVTAYLFRGRIANRDVLKSRILINGLQRRILSLFAAIGLEVTRHSLLAVRRKHGSFNLVSVSHTHCNLISQRIRTRL